MITLQTKIDYALTDEGKVFARELNLVSDSLKNIILAAGDSRPGEDNAEAVLGAIDDISRSQLFKLTGPVLSKYADIPSNSPDVVEIKDDHLMYIYVDSGNPMLDIISINGISYSVTIFGSNPSDRVTSEPIIFTGVIDKQASALSIIAATNNNVSGLLSFDSISIIDNASYTTPVNIDITDRGALLLVEQSTTQGSPKVININNALVDGSFVILENFGRNEVTDTIVNFSSPVKGVGSSLTLNTVSFRVKIFVEGGESKIEVLSHGTSSQFDTPNANLSSYDNSNSQLPAISVQSAVDELSIKIDSNATDITSTNQLASDVSVGISQLSTDTGTLLTSVLNSINNISSSYNMATQIGVNTVLLVIKGRLFSFSRSTLGESFTSYSAGYTALNNDYFNGLGTGIEVYFPFNDYSTSAIVEISQVTYGVTLVRFDDGKLYAWGSNGNGQCGLGHNTPVYTPTLTALNVNKIASAKAATASSAGADFSVIVKNDGTLWSTGFSNVGQTGLSTTANVLSWTEVAVPPLGSVKNVWKIGTNNAAMFVGTSFGTLLATGSNISNKISDQPDPFFTSLRDVTSEWLPVGEKVVDVTGGMTSLDANGIWPTIDDSSIAVLTDFFMVYTKGSNTRLQRGTGLDLNLPATSRRILFPAIAENVQVVELNCVASMTYVVRMINGDVYSWGNNDDGILGDGTLTPKGTPVLIATGVKRLLNDGWVSHLNGRTGNIFWESLDGSVWSTGVNSKGARGIGHRSPFLVPTRVMLPKEERLDFLTAMMSDDDEKMIIAVMLSGRVYVWGSRNGGAVTDSSSGYITVPRLVRLTGE